MLTKLQPTAQIALQVPKRNAHPANGIAAELAQEPPFRQMLQLSARRGAAISLAEYSQLLYDHGLREQSCMEKIYGHEMSHPTELIEFLKGSGLNPYLSQLNEMGQAAFLAAYRERLLLLVGEQVPYF